MSKKRTIYGKRTLRTISPFVEDIEQRLMERKQSYLKKKKNQLQLALF